MARTKKQLKVEQAQMQSDAIELDSWIPSDGLLMSGTVDSLDPEMDITYTQLELGLDEDDLRKKYPALQDAHEHYQNILDMCRTREKEESDK